MDSNKTAPAAIEKVQRTSTNIDSSERQSPMIKTKANPNTQGESASYRSILDERSTSTAALSLSQHRNSSEARKRSEEDARTTRTEASSNTVQQKEVSVGPTTIATNTTSNADATEAEVKKRATSSTSRLGQACDRCKVRKIKCDDSQTRCSPCAKQDVVCKTTDRNTGKIILRGYAERLEEENFKLKKYVLELQQQLREHGLAPKEEPKV